MLESTITEQEHVKHELALMHKLMDQQKVESESLTGHNELQVNGDHDNMHDVENDVEEDRRSILTALPEDTGTLPFTAITHEMIETGMKKRRIVHAQKL